MGPKHQIGKPRLAQRFQRDRAQTAACFAKISRGQLPERNVQRDIQRRTNAHGNAGGCDGVNGAAGLHPCQPQNNHRRRSPQQRIRQTIGKTARHTGLDHPNAKAPGDNHQEISADPAQLERLARQAPGIGPALP